MWVRRFFKAYKYWEKSCFVFCFCFWLKLSQDEATTFYDELNHHIFELVSSSDVNEKKGGILAIGEYESNENHSTSYFLFFIFNKIMEHVNSCYLMFPFCQIELNLLWKLLTIALLGLKWCYCVMAFSTVSLIGVEGGNATRISRFANYLRNLLPSSDSVVMEMASKAMGHLSMAGDTFTAEYVEFEVKRALEWLGADRNEGRRHAAVRRDT